MPYFVVHSSLLELTLSKVLISDVPIYFYILCAYVWFVYLYTEKHTYAVYVVAPEPVSFCYQ